jgi:hypothetical protein
MFPSPIHFERPGQGGWKIRDWDTANQLLGYLDPVKRPAAIFTREDGSYIQCAGSKRRLVVEARVITSTGFSHFRFGRGSLSHSSAAIECSIGPITCDETQVLALRDARKIINSFLENGTLDNGYVATEVTAEFNGELIDSPILRREPS